jgi:hypothetical protein
MDQRRVRRLSLRQSDWTCIVCGQSDMERLTRHRVAGVSITLCQQCYRRLTATAAPPVAPIWTPPDDLESIARALLAEADFLSLLAQSRTVLAHVLIDRVRREAPTDDE